MRSLFATNTMYDKFQCSICALITCCSNFGVCRLTTNQCTLWWYMCDITMETRVHSHNADVPIPYTCLCLHARLYVGRYALKPHVVSRVYWVVAQFTLDGIYEPHKWLSVSHLVGGVDCGPCLEECPHHTGMTVVRCHHQRSRPILWSSEGGGSKVVPIPHVRCYYTAVCKSLPTSSRRSSICFWNRNVIQLRPKLALTTKN